MLAAPAAANPNGDIDVAQPPSDTVSSISWSPVHRQIFVAGSWDMQVRCWEVANNGAQVWTTPKAAVACEGPVLSTAFSAEGHVIMGGCDNKVRLWQLGQPQAAVVGQHAAPVRQVGYNDEYKLVMSGSWDKTIKYWDTRSPTPSGDVPMAERVYGFDTINNLLAVVTAGMLVVVYDMRNPKVEWKRIAQPLQHQLRCVSVFPDMSGLVVGSIGGRCAVNWFNEAEKSKNFTFRCHRDTANKVYAVNDLSFSRVFGTFATVGSDGVYNFWDKDSKQRLKPFHPVPLPLTSCGFSADSQFFAYSMGYDWSKGVLQHNLQAAKNAIYLHVVKEDEIKARPAPPAAAGARR